MADGPKKKELQNMLDQVGEKVSDMLDPVLTREELVAKLQELDDLVNATEEEEEFDEEEGDNGDEADDQE